MSNSDITPKVGQEVAIVQSGRWSTTSFGYVVTKVTPSGQFTAENKERGIKRRFQANRQEIDALYSPYNKPMARFDVAELRAEEVDKEARREASEAIMNVRVERCERDSTKVSMLRQIEALKKLLHTAEIAVKKIPN